MPSPVSVAMSSPCCSRTVPGDHVAVLARRVLAALELPLTVRGTTVVVAASIGIATAGPR